MVFFFNDYWYIPNEKHFIKASDSVSVAFNMFVGKS